MTGHLPPTLWDQVAQAYGREIVPIFERFSQEALRLVAPAAGSYVLDVACGPGTLALQAAAAGSRVIAVDSSPRMIEQLRLRAAARRLHGVGCLVAEGQALPVASEAFDAAFSMFGLIFFPDRARGFQELWRALRPDGRAAVSCWAPLEKTAFLDTLWTSLRQSFLFLASPAPRLSSPEALWQEMVAAGFRAVDVHPLTQVVTRESVESALEWFALCSPQLLQLREQRPWLWSPFIERTRHRLTEVFGPGQVHVELTAYLAIGYKPEGSAARKKG